MVTAGTETGAQVFGCVMEQGGEKEKNHARTACPSSPNQRKFLPGLVQGLVHKQGKASSAHPPGLQICIWEQLHGCWGYEGAQTTCPARLLPAAMTSP